MFANGFGRGETIDSQLNGLVRSNWVRLYEPRDENWGINDWRWNVEREKGR
jgi:hypothetical protein